MKRLTPLFALAAAAVIALGGCSDAPTALTVDDAAFARGGNKDKGGGGPVDADMAALGELLFKDINLSLNGNQACSTCHEPAEGFAAPVEGVTTQGSVVQGSIEGAFGDRKPPTAAYATLSPIFDPNGQGATGGNFWDGRATGLVLGNPAADQALGPFLNPKEQALPDAACVIWKVASAAYAVDWVAVWGEGITQIAFPGDTEETCGTAVDKAGEFVDLTAADRAAVNEAYDQVALSIAAFEATLNQFSSRFDTGSLNAIEQEGEKLFSSKGKCHQCHDTKGSAPLFTDYQFHNLGVPRNPDHPVYPMGVEAFDPGLGGFTGNDADIGRFKTPTVRNAEMGSNRRYMHNGSLVDLRQVVQFYNTRDVMPTCGPQVDDPADWGPDGVGCWPAPEFGENMDTKNMGNLGLTSDEVDAIVAFMFALTDE